MKFVAFFLLVVVVVTGLGNRTVRSEVGVILRRFWPALVVGSIAAVIAFVLAYSGEALRLF